MSTADAPSIIPDADMTRVCAGEALPQPESRQPLKAMIG